MTRPGTRGRALAAAAGLALLGPAPAARAGESDLALAVRDLTARVRQLEASQRSGRSGEWTPGIRVHGNADLFYLMGERNSIAPDGRFNVDNARLFFDVDLGWDAELYGRPLLSGSSFYVEWDIARYGILLNDIGQLYARLDGLLGSTWLNAKIGRIAIPYGEEYLRWYEERPGNPLLDFSAPSPYNWDEGVMLFGSDAEGRLGYVLSFTDGDDGFGDNTHTEPQVAGRLFAHPVRWARLSVSGLHSGGLGDSGTPARSAMKFGWSQAIPFGSGTSVPSFMDGSPLADDPSNVIDHLAAWEVDAILFPEDWGRLWLAFGQIFIDSGGASRYDRDLLYWIAEAIVELGALSPALDPFYLAVRYSEIGTYDSGEGYRLIALNEGWDLGFNTKRVMVVSSGLGMRITEALTLKAQYTHVDFETVRGVTSAIQSQAGGRDWFGLGLSLGF